ncbi:MAG: carboxypeptidase regulatory-like domain-containing protein, partial [Deltaproteobacteria bacterium]|nr:carboxypeptidase regulatory-like domain-containing protein [Deltaproteobacteria bacterium]
MSSCPFLVRTAACTFVTVALAAGCEEEPLVADPSGVAGNVCNPLTGVPAAYAEISCTYVDEVSGDERVRTTQADRNGFFTLAGIAIGERTIVARTPDFQREYQVTIDQGVT